MNKKQKGFSLIELLIVVAIILIIAAIAIPNLLRARMAANESSAVGTVRTLVTSEVTYSSTWNTGFSDTLAHLGGTAVPCVASSTSACLIDPLIAAGGPKSGYFVAAVGGTPVNGVISTFGVSAYPVTQGTTGTRTFCSDESGVVRVDVTGAVMATPTDTGCAAFPSLQ
ncbi:MAG: prepilin-type N-terminal cleavage/methylation domain-containing protein [Candidatus Acidiferrales bacterium]